LPISVFVVFITIGFVSSIKLVKKWYNCEYNIYLMQNYLDIALTLPKL
jgi:hypothetical protein